MSEPDLDALTEQVEQALAADGDRYPHLVAAHDAVREALADDDTQAPGR
ncbi:MAG: hypothetical protein U0R28_04770 [Candidatus Nanopelagicales bacterium]